MTNREFQEMLREYPDDFQIKLMIDHTTQKVKDFDEENILETSETAFVNDEAPEEEWDHEDGKIDLGDGQKYLLINPIIV